MGEEEEPICQYVPEDEDHPKLNGDALFTQSLLLLSDGLASGALLEQYEQLYRKNPHLIISEAKRQENLAKNRYRDISPCELPHQDPTTSTVLIQYNSVSDDCNRVVIINSPDGGYINANYVNMEIPNDCVNRYIATQGPLANTVIDFWRMVQQESSSLIVMLTTVMERGRSKCYQYWPQVDEELELTAKFSVKSLKEIPDPTGSFVLRDLRLTDKTVLFNEHYV